MARKYGPGYVKQKFNDILLLRTTDDEDVKRQILLKYADLELKFIENEIMPNIDSIVKKALPEIIAKIPTVERPVGCRSFSEYDEPKPQQQKQSQQKQQVNIKDKN